MAVLSATTAVNEAVAKARTLPELISGLPPDLALQLEAKPLLASKTPWGTLLATAIAWTSSKYALNWDDTTCSLVAGVALLAASYAMRAITKQAVSGVVSVPAGTPPSVAALPPATVNNMEKV